MVNGSGIPRIPGKGRPRNPACARGTRCAQQAALRGCNWDEVGERGEGWQGEASREGNPAPLHTHALPRSLAPWALTFSPHPGLLCPPSRSPHALPDPHLFKRDLQPHRPWRPKEGISAPVPAGLWLSGPGGRCPQKPRPPGEGVFSLPLTGWELGEGAGQGRKRAGAVFVAALPSGTDGWEGRGYVAGGGGVRGPADEEPRISTPRVSREKPPPHLFPAPVFFLRGALASGPRQTLPRNRPPRARPRLPERPRPPQPGAGQAGGVQAPGSCPGGAG